MCTLINHNLPAIHHTITHCCYYTSLSSLGRAAGLTGNLVTGRAVFSTCTFVILAQDRSPRAFYPCRPGTESWTAGASARSAAIKGFARGCVRRSQFQRCSDLQLYIIFGQVCIGVWRKDKRPEMLQQADSPSPLPGL